MKTTTQKLTLIILFLMLFAGCMRLEGYDVLSKSDGIDGAFKDNNLIIRIYRQGWPLEYKIDKNRSFLVSPSGGKSHFTTEAYDIGYGDISNSPYRKICRLDRYGKRCHSWKNGVWKLTIVIKDDKTEVVEEMEIHIANVLWSPMIHGVPK
jgi:hypothetical protein